jgi:hypothetical protein
MSQIKAQSTLAARLAAFAWPGIPQTTPAGKDYFCETGATGLTTSSILAYENLYQKFPGVTGSSSTTAGALNSSIAPPTDNPRRQGTLPMVNLC